MTAQKGFVWECPPIQVKHFASKESWHIVLTRGDSTTKELKLNNAEMDALMEILKAVKL
jgi:hypothetical protein